MWRISRFWTGIVCLVLWSQVVAQNNWIDFNQQYYKLKIADDGLYRITAQELEQAGVPVNTISRGRYQLWRQGEEVAIYAHDGNNDQVIEYLEFYGEKNDGKMDTELYVSADAQPHTHYSLFTDTAAYFLTWRLTSSSTRRMQISTDKTSGLPVAPYHLQDRLELQVSNYATGPGYGPGSEVRYPLYDYGEGWIGSTIGKNQSRSFTFGLSGAVQAGPAPQLEVLLTGANNLQHLVEISAGPNENNLRSLGQAAFEGRFNHLFNAPLTWSDLNGAGNLTVKITVVGYEGQSDFVSIGYLKCTFPQSFSWATGTAQQAYRLSYRGNQKETLLLSTSEAGNLRVLDVTSPFSPVRLSPTAYPDRMEVVYTASGTSRNLLVVRNPKTVPSIKRAEMKAMDLASSDYLIVSHSTLDQAVDGEKPVSAYGAYRSSAAGGGYHVLIADIINIYDQFSYGDPSPLALRNFLAQAVSSGDPKFLFLIGKGTSTEVGYWRRNPNTSQLIHYIPTYGHPGSDWLFSVGIKDDLVPALATGRLNALEAKDVKAYLDKVREMEASSYNALWRKRLVLLSGGKNSSERNIFANYTAQFERTAEGHYLGGRATKFYKENNNPVQVINIAAEVNQGVGLVAFFGHSGPLSTDLEIGKVSNPDQGYNNAGKYPVFLVNGCNAGEIFGTNISSQHLTFGEDWMRTPDKGALAFIANSDYSTSSNLKRYSDHFFQVAFTEEENFGRTVGEILVEVNRRFLTSGTPNETQLSQVYQTVLQGDPAVRIFGADKPDYHLVPDDISVASFDGSRVLASLDSFKVLLPVRNYGRTSRDLLKVKIERTLPDGKVISSTAAFDPVLYQDTLEFMLVNDPENAGAGLNVFQITVDPDNEQAELRENNNTARYEYFMHRGSTMHLFPIDCATLNDPEVALVWQASNLLETMREYVLEVDTLPIFTSPYRAQRNIRGGLLLSEKFNFSNLPDSTTIYWRTRYAEPRNNEDTSWVSSSFTLVAATSGGWGQFHGNQLRENELMHLQYDQTTEQFVFQETASLITLSTHGPESGLTDADYQVIIDGVDFLTSDADDACKRHYLNAVFIDRETAKPYRPFGLTPTDVRNDLVCGRSPQMIHNLSREEVIDLSGHRYLDSLIGKMKPRDMVLLFSFGDIAYSEWDEQIKSSLRSVGISGTTVDNLTDGQPVVFLGRKGDTEGTAIELVSDGSGAPVKEQVLTLVDVVKGRFSYGAVRTGKIGPAKAWKDFSYSVQADEASDYYGFEIYGITPTGNEQWLFSGSRTNQIDMSVLDAEEYPYLRMQMTIADDEDQTPPQLNGWAVAYDLPPEGLLMPQDTDTLEVQEGVELSRTFVFKHLTGVPFTDSLQVSYTLTNLSSGERNTNTLRINAPEPDDTVSFDLFIPTKGKSGKNNLSLQVAAQEQELYLHNNSLTILDAFTVNADNINPVLDVTFDGGYILDGDIVSPSPNILIRFKDENQYLFKKDTSGIRIDLKSPCEGCDYERVKFTSSKVSYTPASADQDFEVNYSPGPLEDGIYSLRVSGTDESGNDSGKFPYEITFEVVNESTITHFYPYPNPFSTSTRFVFTLTGSIIPTDVKIQIMTVTGRVVREITREEIGPLKIGSNITQPWDGRDEYGDQLANGVYLYKVFIKEDGSEIKHRNTSADRGFKHGFGKMYILR